MYLYSVNILLYLFKKWNSQRSSKNNDFHDQTTKKLNIIIIIHHIYDVLPGNSYNLLLVFIPFEEEYNKPPSLRI